MKLWIAFLMIFLCQSGYAHQFDVLYPYSLGKEAADFNRSSDFKAEFRTYVVDGEIDSSGTGSITFDRYLASHTRVVGNLYLTDKFYIRSVISVVGTYRKKEGKDAPRIIREESYVDTNARLELTYVTHNNVEFFFGLDYRNAGGYESNTESVDLESKESYSTAALDYYHIGFVKRAPSFQGGFYFQPGVEKSRTVEKTSSLDSTSLEFEDVIQNPARIGFFARTKLWSLGFFGEFSAVQAGDGGNKAEDGSSVEEDYIRLMFQLDGAIAFVNWNAAIIHKTLSYASSQSVELSRIPQTGLHLGGKLQLGGFEAFGSIILAQGNDGQSVDEFNAEYSLVAVGASGGIALRF